MSFAPTCDHCQEIGKAVVRISEEVLMNGIDGVNKK